jgi:hypothetical protein
MIPSSLRIGVDRGVVMGEKVQVGFKQPVPIGEVITELFGKWEAVKASRISQALLDKHWFQMLYAEQKRKQVVALRDELASEQVRRREFLARAKRSLEAKKRGENGV